MTNIPRALSKAYDLHQDQRRKCSQAPYFVHILDVARHLIAEPNITEDVIVAGILHDTLEDTPYTAEALEQDFGPTVRQLVEFNTEPAKDHHTCPQDKQQTWKQRKQHTLNDAPNATRDQLLVLLADKLANLQSLHNDLILHGDTVWTHFNASKDDTAWYYRELQKTFQSRLSETRMQHLFEKLLLPVFQTR